MTSNNHDITEPIHIPTITDAPDINKDTMNKQTISLIRKILPKAALLFFGYILSRFQWSFMLLIITVITLIYLEAKNNKKINKIKVKSEACEVSKEELIKKINEIPSWVKFPDRERAEWLNQIIGQLWPNMRNYITKIFRSSIQTKIRKKYESFRFEEIDFGSNPPKIDGIKVYNCATTRDQVIIDFDVFYDGNCDINFSLSGAQLGGIRDFQLSVEVRIVLKPLLHKLPLIGGIQIFFLNPPDLNFNLDGLSGIPGFNSFITSKIEEKLTKLLVFPNKVTKRFSKSVQASELRALEPAGVLRVHVSEAKDLEGKDITGKSDPYVVVYAGAQEYRTHWINQSLNPKWDSWFEFAIADPTAQHLSFKVYDHDNVNEDDFLGSGDVDVSAVLKGDTDQWIKLDNAKHGKLHLRFTWLSLSSDLDALNAASEETKQLQVIEISTAVLIVYVESAQNLPGAKPFVKPHPFFIAMVGNNKQKSKVKKHTTDPQWEQGFIFLVRDPKNDYLYITIVDKPTNLSLTQLSYKISDLIKEENLEISKTEFLLDDGESKIVLSLQLRILSNDLFEFDESESESDSESNTSRRSSGSTGITRRLTPIRNPPNIDDVEEKITSATVTRDHAQPTVIRTLSTDSSGEYGLGRVEMTLSFSELRQKFLVTIHRLHLPMKDPTDIPDPYVKVVLKSQNLGTSIKHKTKVKYDCCDPIFEETFEYLLSKSEVYEQSLIVNVRTVKFFNNNTVGKVELNLKYLDLREPSRTWYDLQPKNSS